jgi:hypothetical protein
MGGEEQDPSLHVHGPHNSVSSPYINIQIPRPSASTVQVAIGIVIGMGMMFALTIAVAMNANWKADNTIKEASAYEERTAGRVGALGAKYDLMHLWAQRVIVACEANGVKVPPIPMEASR